MSQGIKRNSKAAIDSKHNRVANNPLVLTKDGEQMLPIPGARTGKMGPQKKPSFKDDATPKRAKQRASTELVRGARLALAERVISEISRSQAEEEVRNQSGAPRRSKSGHAIGGTHSHYEDLPKAVRSALSPADAFWATPTENPEKHKAKRIGRLSDKSRRRLRRTK